MDLLYLAYIHAFLVGLPALAVALVAVGTIRAGLPARDFRLSLIVPVVVLSVWAAAAMWLSRQQAFAVPATPSEPPVVLAFLFAGAAAIWALARATRTGRRITDAHDPGTVIAFQIPRVMGVLFLLGWATGTIPWQFALPAGLGDIWAGIAGYQAWKAAQAGAPDARKKIVRANVIGIADFTIAVLTGIATSAGFAQIWAHDVPNIINLHPLAMFPAFFVPLFLGFHLISISKLRQVTALARAA